MTLHRIEDLERVETGPVILGKALGIERQTVADLARKGILIKTARGQYPLIENFRRYLDYKQQGLSADAWREARTENLQVRTERERIALARDRLEQQVQDFDAGLDIRYWELLVEYVNFADACMFELERHGLLADVPGVSLEVANRIHAHIINARCEVRDRMKEYRRTQAAEFAEQLDDELDAEVDS